MTGAAELRLESVSKAYTRGRAIRRALADVSLEVYDKEFVAILGEPRSGKSTLLRIAAGIEPPDGGRVLYRGRDLATLSDRELAEFRRRGVAWVAANRPWLSGYRAVDFVGLPVVAFAGERRRAYAAACEALAVVGAGDCGDAALDELSESEAQRVGIAQALVRRPAVIAVDEPAAGLGMAEARAILDLLRRLSQEHGFGVVVTASEASDVVGATRVLGLLSGGRIVDPGPGSLGADVVALPSRRRAGDA